MFTNDAVGRTVDFIEKFCTEHGYAPSVRQVAEAAGFKSPTSGLNLLKQLEAEGYIKRMPGHQRAIQIVRTP